MPRGRCAAHQRTEQRQDQDRRGTAHARGYDSKWQKARVAYLRKHPLCVRCADQGRTTAARVVDHIVPHKGDKALFWDSAKNWQSLCSPCHDRKTATEDGGFGTRRTPSLPSSVKER